MFNLTQREKLLAFSGVLMVLFLASLNLTVVGTALPRVIAELEGFSLYAWVFTSFSLTSTVSLPIYGKLSDLYGRKGILLFGIALFTLSSVLAGLSQTIVQLILFRALQGLGGGALMGMAFATIGDIFTPRERGKYQGFNGAVFGISSLIGPVIGGLITDTIGWRWVFFVNVPVAVVAALFIVRYLPSKAQGRVAPIDYLGSALLVAGVVPLLLALTWGGVDYPWTSPLILGLLAGSLALLTAFAAWQTRAPDPILAPRLFRNATFNIANIAGFLTSTALFGAIIYLPLFVQGVQGGSAAASGFALTPLMGGLVVSSALAGLWVARTGRYKTLILLGTVTMLAALYLLTTMGPATPTYLTSAYMVLLGVGLGPTNSLFVLAVQNAFPLTDLGVVTSANQFFRQIGGTLSVAVFGAIVTLSLSGALAGPLAASEGVPPETLAAFSSPNLLTDPDALQEARRAVEGAAGPGSFEPLIAALRGALAEGISRVFWVILLLTLLALLVSLALPKGELEDTPVAEARTDELSEGLPQAAPEPRRTG